MAALFDLDAEGDVWAGQRLVDDASADLWFGRALDHARAVGGRDGLARLRGYAARVAAAEAELLAAHVDADGGTRRAERLLADGRTSKREQARRARRAKAVGANRELGERLAAGKMSEEQVDVIADAAEQTSGDAAVDEDLIGEVAAVSPEQGRGIVDKYLAERKSAGDVQSEHDRQRLLRRASKYFAKKHGLDTISLGGDGVASKQMWAQIEKRAEQMYQADGGRDQVQFVAHHQ